MNEIKVITELCAEDRARIDKTNDLLITLIDIIVVKSIADKCVEAPQPTVPDELTQKLLEAVKITPEELREDTPTNTPSKEETKPTKAVSRTELGAKVREMMTKGFKEETKAIVKEYAPTVPGVPDDKVSECYERLVALEG